MLKNKKTNDPIYDKDGVFKVEQISEGIDLITMRQTLEGYGAVVYQQISWNRKTLEDKRVRILTCF